MAVIIHALSFVSGYGAFIQHGFGPGDHKDDEADHMDSRREMRCVGSRRFFYHVPCSTPIP